MGQRLQLHELLKTLLGSGNVYFQPPGKQRMEYPAIRYERDSSDVDHADNSLYRKMKRYRVTMITHDPDSTVPDALEELPMSRFEQFYAADNLNHFVFQIFY